MSSSRLPAQHTMSGEFKCRRKSRSRRGNEAEVFFAPKSASLRRRLPFSNTPWHTMRRQRLQGEPAVCPFRAFRVSISNRFQIETNAWVESEIGRTACELLLLPQGGEGRGEEAVWVGDPSLRLSPRSCLAGREGAWLRPPVGNWSHLDSVLESASQNIIVIRAVGGYKSLYNTNSKTHD